MKKTLNYRLFGWMLAAVLAVFLVLYGIASHQLSSRREEETALRATLNRLEDENKEMDAQLKLVDTEDYIVSSAMNNFAFMNRNDLRFQFTNPEALYAYTEEELEILMAETAE